MRWESVYVAATGSWLPEPYPTRAAVEAGSYDPEQFEADALLSIRVADEDVAPPDMAVHAATTALKRSGLDAETVSLLLHSYVWFQGQTLWPVASYVADKAIGRGVPAFELKQECNAGTGAMELAARHLATTPGAAAAMLTTADRFGEPLIDRWRDEAGIVYGDGGTALLLSNQGGFAKLLSTATRADNSLEVVTRGPGFTPLPDEKPLGLAERLGHYLQHHGNLREATQRLVGVAVAAVDAALADAGKQREDITWAVIPASGRSKMEWQAGTVLGLAEDRTSWEFARRSGHLGAGDQFAGLNDLAERGLLRVGDTVLLIGAGSGFTSTCAVLEITEEPTWQTPAAHDEETRS
ncbi:ketoacyl-ACP synthase III family protein [Streptomyces scabiei]|uniref:ketoacyl-ACP synthase III family protein n=1 Tax=Streptomyces scabiei TaxID=1930 RepID=UPI0029A35D3C|nr:ketoacyl-ACP synthase III family protein [Streptomyces scabiei]MDX3517406.1 ketoacyl-ACP synthase III family protein [Streptomyces scabiei]